MADRAALAEALRQLGDDSWRARKQAIDAVVAWPEPRAAAEALVEVLADTDEVALRNSALEALGRIGTAALPPLVRELDRRGRHRKFLIDALGGIGDVAAAAAVAAFATDDDANVRVAAAEALGRIGGEVGERGLLRLARDHDMMVQVTALDALAARGAAVGVRDIELALRTPVVRCSALRLLGCSRSPDAVDPLIEALGDRTRRAREAAICALAKLSESVPLDDRMAELDEPARERLAEALEARDPEVKNAAAVLVGLGRHREASGKLAAGVANPHTGAAFARALRRVEGTGAAVPLAPGEFARLRDLIHEHCGIYFQDDSAYLVQRRLAPRLEATGTVSFADYYRKLQLGAAGRQELAEAVERITTNETYFFREAYQLRAFRDEILPALRAANGRSKRLSVWSAGCSTGEEPYTIAMILADADFDDWRVEVLGTDISRRVLSVAHEGVYGASSMRAIEPAALARFFRERGGRYEVRDGIRARVRFQPVNLTNPREIDPLGSFDVIFCRNVLMYFDRESRRRVVRSFYERLVPGGYLLLGHSESLLSLSTDFELVQLQHDMVYRRPPP